MTFGEKRPAGSSLQGVHLPANSRRDGQQDESGQQSDTRRQRYRHRQHGWSDQDAWRRGFIDDVEFALILIRPYLTLFHEGTAPMAEVTWQTKTTTMAIADKRLVALIAGLFQGHTGQRLQRPTRREVLQILTDEAVLGPERQFHLRTVEVAGGVCIHLGAGRAATVDGRGYRVTDLSPVSFLEAAPLPEPQGPSDLMRLRRYLNVDDDAFQLVVAWLTFSLLPHGPYPVLHLIGEHGSAKSTATRLLYQLVDGGLSPGGAMPGNKRDFDVLVKHVHLLVLENLSSLPGDSSDWLCRLATGSEESRRANYSNSDRIVFAARRPILMNGIANVIARPDLADRAIVIELEPIPEDRRRPENEVLQQFEKDAPQIMSGVLDVIGVGLRNRPAITADNLPRMADFAMWGLAIEPAYWPAGSFLKAYRAIIQSAAADTVDEDEVAQAIVELLNRQNGFWQGSYTDLLIWMEGYLRSKGRRSLSQLPGNPRALSERVSRLKPDLRKQDIHIGKVTRAGAASKKLITIERRSA